jgi:S-(hydroxymethyl)glutathione dehydrogenase/alcohol dehydrogenase
MSSAHSPSWKKSRSGRQALEVLVRTAATGVCASDRLALNGLNPRAPRVPLILGHEAAGVVEAVGADVTSVRPGTPVVVLTAPACGFCAWCERGLQQHCVALHRTRRHGPARLQQSGVDVDAFVGVGGFADHMLVHERGVAPVPDEMPLDLAALLGCAVLTGFGAVRHTARVHTGDRVLVIGCGGIGLNVVQAARLAGALEVVVVDPSAAARARAVEFGSTLALDPAEQDVAEAVRSLTGVGADHAFDVVGSPQTLDLACAAVRPRGTVTVVGLPRPDSQLMLPTTALFDEKRVQGHRAGQQARRDIADYASLYLAGRLILDGLVSRRLPLADVGEAIAVPSDGDLARHLVVFDH